MRTDIDAEDDVYCKVQRVRSGIGRRERIIVVEETETETLRRQRRARREVYIFISDRGW